MKYSKIIAVLIFFAVSGNVFSQNADIRILRSLNSPESLPADGFYRFITDSHYYVIIGANLTLGVSCLVKKDKPTKQKALEMAISSIATVGITEAMKYTINRKRPFETYPDITKKTSAGDPSFPSGHTSVSFSAATSLSLSYPEWYVIIPSYAWAGVVGYSRMRLGAHYPSDVLAGALIGSGTAWLTHHITRKLNSR